MLFNNEVIKNIKEAKDVVASYLFDRAFCYSYTKKTPSGTRHDVELYRDDKCIPIEIKARKNTNYRDYKIEYSKIEYLKNLPYSLISVICLDKGVIKMIPVKLALEKGWKEDNDIFPINNDNGRYEYKKAVGFHIKWDDFTMIQPCNCNKYDEMIDKAVNMVGKTDNQIIDEIKPIWR